MSASAIALIDSIRDHRVLFVGDSIVDEYHYVTALGKSPKEHLITVAYEDQEVFEGGVLAAAKHAATFCGGVWVATTHKAVRKVRMVDRVYLRKLFEIHYNQDTVPFDLPEPVDFDAVVVTDFGHGQITPAMIETLVRLPNYLAVNAQTNSANVGFNLITKYSRADYVVIDEPEARLAAGDRTGKIEDVIQFLAQGRYEKMVVTQGSHGAIGYERGVFTRREAMTQRVVDTMGAGDAFFAVTAPMAKTGHMRDLLLIGNAAGALKTQIIGHRASVTKSALIEYMRAHETS
jgi:bifunctional ADP-heptose synthase (sugar kinase/adenylyltransferase)